MHCALGRIRFLAAVLFLAAWWGGFTFYALVVVPTGHKVLKSKVRQGFITQQVTEKLNVLAAVTSVVLLWQLTASPRDGKSLARFRAAWLSWAALAITLAVLFWLHPRLDAMLDPSTRSVTDDARFYDWHRWYLIVATVQWLAGLVHLVTLIREHGHTPQSAVTSL